MNSKKTKTYCDEALSLNSESFFGLLFRGKSQMDKEEYEDAVRTFDEAQNLRPDKQDIVRSLLQKAKIALKRSKTKDYYKVLGVSHDIFKSRVELGQPATRRGIEAIMRTCPHKELEALLDDYVASVLNKRVTLLDLMEMMGDLLM